MTENKKVLTRDEEADEIVRRLKTPPASPFKILMPMIRKILPTSIANEIMGVQPMTGPVGEIFTIKPNFKDDSES